MQRRLTLGFYGFVLLALGIVVWVGLSSQDKGNDTALYFRTAQQIAAGKWPYRDFPLEYPPGAILAFLPPYPGSQLGTDSYESYCSLFAVWGVVLIALIALCHNRILTLLKPVEPKEWLWTGRHFAALSILMCWMITARYDIFPAALTALALWGVLGRQRFLAGVALGVAIAAKLYPMVFAPVFALWLLWRKEWRASGAFVLGVVIAASICFLPFLVHSPNELWSFVAYHSKRGLQIESGAAGLAMLLGNSHRTSHTYGAIHLESPLAATYLPLLTYLFPLAWLAGMVRTVFRLREAPDATRLIECSCGLLLLFMALNKVFSPQFMVWLIPFLPLLKPRWRLFGVPLFLATTLIFPLNYGQLMAGSLPMVLLLSLRNFEVLLLGILLLWGGPKSQEERYTDEHARDL